MSENPDSVSPPPYTNTDDATPPSTKTNTTTLPVTNTGAGPSSTTADTTANTDMAWRKSNDLPEHLRLGRLDREINIKNIMSSNSELSVSDQVMITFEDLGYSVDVKSPGGKGKKVAKSILNGVTGVLKPGRLTAIMGASGAGKTSLLQVLAGEAKIGTLTGQIRVNGEPVTPRAIKRISAFVFQDDLILPTLTVYESIYMSALLRISESVSIERKVNRVNKMIEMLNLEKARNTIIGNATMKGVSGGEKKRVAMAMELVTNPSVLFLDEPTSGLDTFTAHSVVKTLQALAGTGRTIVTTIHQPSSDIFHMFDDLILMADGRIVYQGRCSSVIDYFEGLGYKCPLFTNPADYIFMDILNNSNIEHNTTVPGETNAQRIQKVIAYWPTTDACARVAESITTVVKDYETSGRPKRVDSMVVRVPSTLYTQASYLFGRATRNALRNPLIIRAKVAQTLIIAFIIGAIFYRLDTKSGYAAFQDRTGFLFFATMNNVMSSTMGVLSIFGTEKRVFAREYGAGYYKLLPYFVSKVAVEAPFYAILPWIQITLLYWTVGLQNNGVNYIMVAVTCMLCSLTGFSLGIFFACVFSSLEVALGAAPLILMPLMLLSGLFANLDSVPAAISWIKYISPMKYGYQALVKTELDGLMIQCTASSNNGTPRTVPGSECIGYMGLNDGFSAGGADLLLMGMVVVLVGVGYLSLLGIVNNEEKCVKSKGKVGVKEGSSVVVDVEDGKEQK